jgi:hypothetical protein
MRVECQITEDYLDGDYGEVEGVIAACTLCGNATESYGTSLASVRRCLVTMRESCPMGGVNYYIPEQEN